MSEQVHNVTTSPLHDDYSAVILDVEGTTTPITFVHDELFPYAKSHLESFFRATRSTDETAALVADLRQQAESDIKSDDDQLKQAPQVASTSGENVRWQMSWDRKSAPLKNLQGVIWRRGYQNGELKGAWWKAKGKKIYIYSSGSVAAQNLLFAYSDKGDLQHFFSGNFDSKIGLKQDVSSYTNIATQISVEPRQILFVSDAVRELIAARAAGFQVVLSVRPGNAPVELPLTIDNRRVVVSSDFRQL
ncbi:2,3-diketo-5-methylthio-1-phosphopentane phosphatase [Gonapodya prolifera JEL478]|uniref:2,3-diketo-5-methylthio-1-phosphopentane phosphatase n=1 Tax=Gonapodya prolifera (strain JEL478) TaxID=1344416 RepID=A0A139AJ80_GONPJ|nr:2,3-diketo-5-methylthio-1-phosphopentane phosphatase [Gonapodya prolifera JEL478]|eukprot:KXS16513.1 2,3-diketo-5-methylthio-1-phosphopentane phosphatase [Gonapodya prolifera JEL478]